jgi:hypothetical protein
MFNPSENVVGAPGYYGAPDIVILGPTVNLDMLDKLKLLVAFT